MAWIYLFVASVFEIAWTFSLRFMDVSELKKVQWRAAFNHWSPWAIVGPFAGYIVFGLGNIYFFSLAMKEIPASTALAVWMGTALIGVKLAEMIFLKAPFEWQQFFFMGLILVGIVGLKKMA
ncbi:DMT family transporter [Puia dinghuensis]|uniref:Guanidinium exporter n=1 Tax=Puia dinghuensis TaxID=1792502 RepID=A0A8J2UAH9_9BACT|nr:SMR family transporter [Puia dinghuensis]GGA90453.1 QacE family quaternary ammonium compound efflux SMR transporter [Puia dinghuensis]